MKQRVGLILCITGLILLIKPNFNLEQVAYLINYGITQLWPFVLIMVGISLLKKKPKKRTNKHKTI